MVLVCTELGGDRGSILKDSLESLESSHYPSFSAEPNSERNQSDQSKAKKDHEGNDSTE